jgi:anti-sigma factor RsiW
MPCMGGVTIAELVRLADGALAPGRRAEVEDAVAASPHLARLLAAQVTAATAIRAASARVQAPERLRARLAEQAEARRSNPHAPRRQ